MTIKGQKKKDFDAIRKCFLSKILSKKKETDYVDQQQGVHYWVLAKKKKGKKDFAKEKALWLTCGLQFTAAAGIKDQVPCWLPVL